jgi:hypothetical protein
MRPNSRFVGLAIADLIEPWATFGPVALAPDAEVIQTPLGIFH